VLSEDEEEEIRAGLDIDVSLIPASVTPPRRSSDRKTSRGLLLSPGDDKRDLNRKKWVSLNEVCSDGESRISRNSSLLLLQPQQYSLVPTSDDHESTIECQEDTRPLENFGKKVLPSSWLPGFGRKTSSDSNVDNQQSQEMMSFPFKESVIQTNV